MLISVTGPSGIGKGRICEELLNGVRGLREMPWHTTRALRVGEEPTGKRLHVSVDEFSELRSSGKITLVQQLYGNWYGIEAERLDVNGGLWLTELHIDNAIIHLGKIPQVLAIAVIPAEMDLLEERLRLRSTETERELQRRLLEAKREVFLINENHHLFSRVFEVSKYNEEEICDMVVLWILQRLKEVASHEYRM
jgi:guanylate kinase